MKLKLNRYIYIGIVLVIAVIAMIVFSEKKQEVAVEEKISEVELINVSDYQSGSTVISAFGQVESLNQVDLKSQLSGNLKSVNVKIGDQVSKGQLIAEIDHDTLDAQLDQSKANIDRLRNGLDLKVAGATNEQINVSQKQLDSAKTALQKAESNLADIQKLTEENMKSKYNYAASSLDDANIKIYNSYTLADSIRETYFNNYDQQGIRVKSIVDSEMGKTKDASDTLVSHISSSDFAAVDSAIDQTIKNFDLILSSLTEIRDICDKYTYKNTVPNSVRTSIDSQKSVISSVKNSMVSLKNDISVLKTQNENSINSAKSAIDTAKSGVAVQEASLGSVTASPRDIDLEGINASIKEAEAAYRLIQANRDKAFIRAPFDGKVSAMPLKDNNFVTSGQIVASLVNENGMQVKAYVSEKDSGYVEEGALVKIKDGVDGIVSNISPSVDASTKKIEIIIPVTSNSSSLTIGDNVEPKVTVKNNFSGTDKFLLPFKAIKFSSGKTYVCVVKDGLIEEKEVELGKTSNESVEILKGLSIDDKVVASSKGLKAGQSVKVKE
ncbi:MAG: efflux RND transporter periplasmic adaptor subunit [Candidatus Pacebacteria bacterium]|nr:efflux RND transporter periplasmic adaptor subunit [Candidatus Paceibacterota bacterium]